MDGSCPREGQRQGDSSENVFLFTYRVESGCACGTRLVLARARPREPVSARLLPQVLSISAVLALNSEDVRPCRTLQPASSGLGPHDHLQKGIRSSRVVSSFPSSTADLDGVPGARAVLCVAGDVQHPLQIPVQRFKSLKCLPSLQGGVPVQAVRDVPVGSSLSMMGSPYVETGLCTPRSRRTGTCA